MSVDVICKTSATATGGGDGAAGPDDGSVDVKLVVPEEMGGPGGTGANPEKLAKTAHEVCPYSNATRGNVDVAPVIA